MVRIIVRVVLLLAVTAIDVPSIRAMNEPGGSAPEVEIRGNVEPAPPGVRLFEESAVSGATSVESFRWDPEWDGVRLRDSDSWTPIFDCAALEDALASDQPERLYVAGISEWSYYAGCIADGLLKRVRPAETSHFSSRSPLEDVVERLDLLSFRSSFARINRDHLKWREMPEAVQATRAVFEFEPTEMWLETERWYYGFLLLATGDWTGDGLEDVLVQFYDDGKIATYVAIKPVVLEAPTADGPLIAHEGNELLRALLLAERRPPSGEPER